MTFEPPAECSTPRKVAYPTRDTALGAAVRQRRQHPTYAPLRAYQCRCQAWHLTTKPLRQDTAA